jgi:ATP-dependent RNA helicase RhlE
MSPLVHKIAGDFLEFPTVLEVAPEQKTAITVSQTVYKVPNFQTKLNLLQHLAEQTETFNKVILFCKTKTSADRVFGCLERNFGKDQVRVIHGNKGQNSRINAIHAFKEEQIRFLVATDVAARGIDITLVSHVVNIDVPIISEDYVHRIGRTGRALQEGDSITFCTPSEEYFLQKITKLIKQQIPETKVPKAVEITKTPYEEQQEMNKEIDRQKRKEDPTFQGAFHEKKSLAARADKEKKRVSATQSKRISRR